MSWPETLLIVDDQPEIRRSVAQLFHELGMEPKLILEAKNANEAIAHFDAHQPDLSLVDVVLLGNSGFDVLQHIRQTDEEAIVLMMTAFPQFDYAMEAIRGRVDHFLVKPITPLQLENALSEVLQHHSRRQGRSPSSFSVITRQLDRIMRGEEGLGQLENALHSAGVDDLPGTELMMSLIWSPETKDIAPLIAEYEKMGGKCVAYRQREGNIVFISACNRNQAQQTRQQLDQMLHTLPAGYFCGASMASRETGVIEIYRRTSFALSYTREKSILNLPVFYEQLDLGRILVSRCHGSLMGAYDTNDEETLIDTLDELMILLRQHHAILLALPALNEMYALESLPVLPEKTQSAEELYLAVLSHFHAYCEKNAPAPAALHMPALRQYLLSQPQAAVNHEEISALTSLSYGYLGDLFRQYKGQSLNEYTRSLRLRQAAELLAGTTCKVYEVARLTGFEGNKHFYGVFQKIYSQTPVQYHETRFEEMEKNP